MKIEDMTVEEIQKTLDEKNAGRYWPAGSNVVSTWGGLTLKAMANCWTREFSRELTAEELTLLRGIPELAAYMDKEKIGVPK